jgi:hypothetical protein
MKTCTRCKTAKDLSEFRYRKSRDYYLTQCKACESEVSALRQRAKRPLLSRETKDRQNANKRAWKERNPEAARRKNRAWHVKSKYGLTIEEHDAFLRVQGGKCAICRDNLAADARYGIAVDHCHSTGRVRGLLCHACNLGLGRFKDNIHALQRAVAYLLKDGPMERIPDIVLTSPGHIKNALASVDR